MLTLYDIEEPSNGRLPIFGAHSRYPPNETELSVSS